VKTIPCAEQPFTLKDSLIIEVGPGPGLLTRSLIKFHGKHILGIEKDARFVPLLNVRIFFFLTCVSTFENASYGPICNMFPRLHWQQLTEATEGNFQLIRGDVLQYDSKSLLEHASKVFSLPSQIPVHIVGNLPFNIATPFLIQQLRDISAQHGVYQHPSDMTLMFQKEVAQRIVAPPHDPNRSRISVISQLVSHVEKLVTIPAGAFVPKPKVDGTIVQFVPRGDLELKQLLPFPIMEEKVRHLFAHRRKTIRNNLGCVF
jgi:dimethyladenosine transferase 1